MSVHIWPFVIRNVLEAFGNEFAVVCVVEIVEVSRICLAILDINEDQGKSQDDGGES